MHMSTFAQYLVNINVFCVPCLFTAPLHFLLPTLKLCWQYEYVCLERCQACKNNQNNNNSRKAEKKVGNLANLFVAKISFDKFNVSEKKENEMQDERESTRTDH